MHRNNSWRGPCCPLVIHVSGVDINFQYSRKYQFWRASVFSCPMCLSVSAQSSGLVPVAHYGRHQFFVSLWTGWYWLYRRQDGRVRRNSLPCMQSAKPYSTAWGHLHRMAVKNSLTSPWRQSLCRLQDKVQIANRWMKQLSHSSISLMNSDVAIHLHANRSSLDTLVTVRLCHREKTNEPPPVVPLF